ncbi:MAG: hypothetical protein OEY97_04305 [Nitrospirota bacterium]|nr:hypothetical protein [Nitrospirota bacterium]
MIKRLSPILFIVLLAACQPKEGAKPADSAGAGPQSSPSAESRPAGSAEAEVANYIRTHMMVKEVRIGEGRQGADGGETIRALYGVVANGGTRDLKKVVIQADLLDANGKPVAAAEFVPVIATRDGAVDEAGLLKGHSERAFGYSIEHLVPKEWKGTARVIVTGLEFHG